MTERETLRYHLPPVGVATVTLYDESADLHRFLRLAGEVDRLGKLDHLGLVRVAWSGAHHPRWEYVVTILYLLQRSKQIEEIHLATRYRLTEEIEFSSGLELLNCWALLTNIGHLHETFSAERALLLEIARSRSGVRQELLGYFHTPELRNWAERVLRELRTYSFFQLLTFVRLEELAQAISIPSDTLELWRAIYAKYVLTTGEDDQLLLLKRIFRNLRRVAYLGLDSHYTPSIFSLDLADVTTDASALARLALFNDVSGIEDDELEGLEHYLYREFYMSRAVLEATAVREQRLRAVIRSALRSDGLNSVIEQLARNSLQETVVAEDLTTVARLRGWIRGDIRQMVHRVPPVMKRQRAVDADRQASILGVRCVWWEAAFGDEWVLQTHAPPSNGAAMAYAYWYAFDAATRVLSDAEAEWRDLIPASLLQTWVAERHAASLIEEALALVFSENLRWEWVARRGETIAVLGTREATRAELRRIMRRRGTSASRQDELRGIVARLGRRPRDIAAVASVNLLGYVAGSRTPAVELDGVIVEAKRNHVVVTIIESKRQRSGARGAAEKALRAKMRRLRISNGVDQANIVTRTSGRLAHAWVTLTLPGDVK